MAMCRVLALALAVSHGLVFDCAQPRHRSGTAVFAKDGLQGRKLGSARSKPRASDAVKDAIAAWEENGDIRGKEGRTGGPAASGERLRELALPLPDSASEAERSSAAPKDGALERSLADLGARAPEPPNEGVRGRKLGSARGKVRASDAIKDAMAAWEEPPGAAAEEPTLKERTTDERALEERMLARAAEPPAAPDYSKPEKGRPKGLLGWLRRREGGDDAEAEGAAKLAESSRLREEIAWAKSQDMPELAADLTRKLLDL